MPKKKTDPQTEPEVQEETKKDRSIVTSINESGTSSVRVKTTRELYMEEK